ncbi:hypothetical protein BRADI_1g47008v3 [Brachypodium distachyon]|uniref:Uncharacterized protein n=1 Tax=Brachypodium distachyon TaxID=15368 RepID=A0A0Q3H8G4_BRADI|nr:hypothetical protein BRADI_1g47008v3 [Brachypodium distachyon]
MAPASPSWVILGKLPRVAAADLQPGADLSLALTATRRVRSSPSHCAGSAWVGPRPPWTEKGEQDARGKSSPAAAQGFLGTDPRGKRGGEERGLTASRMEGLVWPEDGRSGLSTAGLQLPGERTTRGGSGRRISRGRAALDSGRWREAPGGVREAGCSRASSRGRRRFPPELKKKPQEMRELGGEEKQRQIWCSCHHHGSYNKTPIYTLDMLKPKDGHATH